MTERYVISVATYRRPEQLKRLLDSLAIALDERADVVVVDNDPAGSSREIAESHPVVSSYAVETEPGIASARNRGLDFFTDDYFAIIFVDDDEWVAEDWFRHLTDYAKSSGAAVVHGPVETILPKDAPRWMVRGGFYQRISKKTGEKLESAATNNTLLTRAAWVAAGSPRFDTDFSSTGGSDWEFFWGIRGSGARLLFCAEAVVSEDVPANRLSWHWLRQRMMRSGIVGLRVRIKHGEPLGRFMLRSLISMLIGVAQMAVDAVLLRGLQAKAANRVFVNLGRITGLLGKRIHEYKRA